MLKYNVTQRSYSSEVSRFKPLGSLGGGLCMSAKYMGI